MKNWISLEELVGKKIKFQAYEDGHLVLIMEDESVFCMRFEVNQDWEEVNLESYVFDEKVSLEAMVYRSRFFKKVGFITQEECDAYFESKRRTTENMEKAQYERLKRKYG